MAESLHPRVNAVSCAYVERAMAQASSDASVIKAYWQPGCTSCLRMKEFLIRHGVAFVSVNVLEDKDAFAELAALGIRSVPIVRRGQDWANRNRRNSQNGPCCRTAFLSGK
jgi:glutaredoxin